MAAIINDSIQVNAPKPFNKWYMVFDVAARPYNGLAEANSLVPSAYRHIGLTVLVSVNSEVSEYWWSGGTADSNLIKKVTGAVVEEPPVTPTNPTTGWRHANAQDVIDIPNASLGDYIITGPNDGLNIRVRPTFSNVFTLDLTSGPKKILIKGGVYSRIELWMDLKGGTNRDITITNYDGQVKCTDMSIGGMQGVHITGKYDPARGTGDVNFKGHDDGYANATGDVDGKYGFLITNGWGTLTKFLFELTAITRTDGVLQPFDNIKVSYIEAGNGGFTNMTKYDSIAGVVNGLEFNSCYFHDIHSEGIYQGSTSNNDPQLGFTNVLFKNCRFLRTGSDGVQLNQLIGPASIENCVIHAAVNWRSPFQANQDYGISVGVRNGGFTFKKNIVIGGGGGFFQIFTKKSADVNFISSGVVEVDNNLFFANFGALAGYVGNTTNIPNIAFKITNNDFAEKTFLYNQVYTASTDVTQLIRYANDAPLTITGNRWDASQNKTTALVISSGFAPSVTQSNNIQSTIPSVNFKNYMGFASGFNYTNFSDWTGIIAGTYGDESAFPTTNPATTKGQAMSYVANQHYVSRKSKFYKCIQSHNTPQDPSTTTGYWELLYGGGLPPDDVRLTSTDYHNSLGRGLLDNDTAVGVTCAQPTDAATTGITDTAAAASWTHAYGYSSYEWQLYNTNLSGSLKSSGTTTTNVLNFNDLTASSAYQLRVRTICLNGGTSSWTNFTIFSTQATPTVAADILNIAAYDEGNQYEIKFGPNQSLYTTGFRLAGIGSSTLSGTGPTVQAEKIGDRIQAAIASNNGLFYNNAISGKNASNGLPTGQTNSEHGINITNAISSRPDAILVMFPSNDIQAGFTAQQFADNLIAIFNEGMKYGIPTFITGTQPRDAYTASQQALLVDTNNLLKAAIPPKYFIDVLNLLKDPSNPGGKPANILPAYSSGDLIHLNGAGHQILFNAIMPKIQNYFVDQTSTYNQYIVERGVASGIGIAPSSWTNLDTLTDTSLASKLYNRVDGQIYAYRLRARRVSDNNYTISNTTWLEQKFLRTNVDETIQIDPSVDTNGPDTSGTWNTFNGVLDGGPALNSEIPLLNTNGTPTSAIAKVTKVFLNANTGGSNSGQYPIKVMQDGWAVSRTTADRGQITISGLSNTNAYRLTILSSKAGVLTNRATGVWANGKFNGSPLTLPISTTANQYEVGVLDGVIPDSSGNIVMDVYSVGDLGFLSSIVLERYSSTVLVCDVPASPVNSATTSNSSTVSWTAPTGAATYDYELYTPAVGGTLIVADTISAINFTFNSLNPNTTYQVRVRTNCANGLTSGWATAAAFTTQTTPTGPANKISINFHYDSSGIYSNPNWNNWDINGAGSTPVGFTDLKYEDGTNSTYDIVWGAQSNSSQFDNGSTYAAGNTVIPQEVLRQTMSTTNGPGFGGTRPSFNITGLNNSATYDFEFIASRNNTGNSTDFQVVGTTTVSNSTPLVTDSNFVNTVTVSGIAPSGGVITIKWAKSAGSFGYFNGVRITENTGSTPTCAIPTGANSSSVTTTTATIGWTSGLGVTNYDYEVYAGAISGNPAKSGTVSGNSVNLTGLLSSTVYNWRFRSNCSNGVTSGWSTTATFTTAGGGGGSSAQSFFQTSSGYNSSSPSQFGYMYTPAGYNDGNSNTYPLIIFLHGSGETGSNPSDLLVTGLPQLLNAGQSMKSLVFCPQIAAGSNSWQPSIVKKAYDWCVANFRVDTSRFYVTGLSLGASGTFFFVKAYPSLVAAYAVASGSAYTLDVTSEAATLAIIKDIPSLFVHGDGDSGATNEANTKDVLDKLNQASPRGAFSPMADIIYNTGHNNSTWNDNFYDKSKTGVNFPLFFEDWLLLHSKTSVPYTAEKYVAQVEAYITAAKYERAHHYFTKAKSLVDSLPADSNKTALIARYTAAKSTLDTTYGKRYIVNIGATGGLTNINTNSGATGAVTSNLVDYNGTSSSIGFTMTTQTGSALTTPGVDGAYFGLPQGVFTDGRGVAGNGGSFTFTGLNASKSYDIIIIPSKNAVSAGNVLLSPEVTATIGTTVKWLLGSYNTESYIKYTVTGVTSQNVLIKGGWTLTTNNATSEEGGNLVSTTSNVTNYTSRGTGVLTVVILVERP